MLKRYQPVLDVDVLATMRASDIRLGDILGLKRELCSCDDENKCCNAASSEGLLLGYQFQ